MININAFYFCRYLKYEHLGVKIFALNEYKEALEELKKGTISKAMFRI